MATTPTLERVIRRTALWHALRQLRRRVELWNWQRHGRPTPPPPLAKQRLLKEYGRQFSLSTLIETGAYRGDMVYACRNTFAKIVSIELDNILFEEAQRRFARYSHIAILHGDSGQILRQILPTINESCLFWL